MSETYAVDGVDYWITEANNEGKREILPVKMSLGVRHFRMPEHRVGDTVRYRVPGEPVDGYYPTVECTVTGTRVCGRWSLQAVALIGPGVIQPYVVETGKETSCPLALPAGVRVFTRTGDFGYRLVVPRKTKTNEEVLCKEN
jgi:hypothetical protein